jgi:hypothetical protein
MKIVSENHLKIHSKKVMQSLFFWSFKAAFHGHGLEFQDFREYTALDDAKYIDWALSSRENTTIMRRYREDKQGRILCVIDNSVTLWFQWWIKKRLVSQVTALLWTAALKSGESFGWYVFWEKDWMYVPDKKRQSNILILQNLIREAPSKHTPQLWKLLSKNQKRSVMFYLTDREDIEISDFKTLAIKHDLIIIYISTYFENTLYGKGLSSMRWDNSRMYIDLSDTKLKQEYILARWKKMKYLDTTARKYGISFLSIDESSHLYLEFLHLMQRRIWRK